MRDGTLLNRTAWGDVICGHTDSRHRTPPLFQFLLRSLCRQVQLSHPLSWRSSVLGDTQATGSLLSHARGLSTPEKLSEALDAESFSERRSSCFYFHATAQFQHCPDLDLELGPPLALALCWSVIHSDVLSSACVLPPSCISSSELSADHSSLICGTPTAPFGKSYPP